MLPYWNVEVTKKRLLAAIGAKRPGSHLYIRTDRKALVFLLDGAQNRDLRRYRLIFSTDYYGHKDVTNASEVQRLVKCRNMAEAILIANSMLGEEVWSDEYLARVKKILLPREHPKKTFTTR